MICDDSKAIELYDSNTQAGQKAHFLEPLEFHQAFWPWNQDSPNCTVIKVKHWAPNSKQMGLDKAGVIRKGKKE